MMAPERNTLVKNKYELEKPEKGQPRKENLKNDTPGKDKSVKG